MLDISAFFTKNTNIRTVLLAALILRTVWALLVPVSPVADSSAYHMFAQNIAFKHQYAFANGDITAYWPVGTSAIYALLYALFGVSFLPIVIFNIIIGTGIVWLTYKIGQTYLSSATALTAAWIMALWPTFIQFTTILASELIFIFFVLVAIYIWGNTKMPPIYRALFWGSMVCAAAYMRPTALPLIVLLPTIEWMHKRDMRACLTSLVVAASAIALLIAPWAYRNYQQFGHPVLISTNGGVNLWMGNHPGSNGGANKEPVTPYDNEAERDAYLKREAISFILHNPISYLELAVKRAILTYKAETIGVHWNAALQKNLNNTTLSILKGLSTLYWWAVIMLACYGLYHLVPDKKVGLFHVLMIVPAYLFIFPILTVGQDRYHLPINPFLAIYAAYAAQMYYIKRR